MLWLIRGSSRRQLCMPLLIIGLSVVAFGTNSPELAMSLKVDIEDQVGIRLGTNRKKGLQQRCRPFDILGAPGRIRTCDLWLRRPTLYPTELRAPCSTTWRRAVDILTARQATVQRKASRTLPSRSGMEDAAIFLAPGLPVYCRQ